MSEKNKSKKERLLAGVLAGITALACAVTLFAGVLKSDGAAGNENLVFGCDFNSNFTDEHSGKKGDNKGTSFYKDTLHINNEHRAGNSKQAASSYVKYDLYKNIEKSNFTISFKYYANEPTKTHSTILSTGEFGKGINIFNYQGLGISIGKMTMRTQNLSEEELKNGGVRLDHNLLNDGQWHDILITVDRNDALNLYVDGYFNERMNLSKIKDNVISSDVLVIGADAELKYGSEDMFIDDLRIFNKVCDGSGKDLFNEHEWLIATKKGNKVLSDYSHLANKNTLDVLKSAIDAQAPTDKENVKIAVDKINEAIKNVISSAESKKLVNFQILSDTHMATSSNTPKMSLIDTLKNIGEWYKDTSALVVTGDLTDNGLDVQYEKYYDALKIANKAPYTMSITGNHESSYNSTSMEEDNARFLRYDNAYTGDNKDKVYYDHWINGFHLIGLASEETPNHDKSAAILSDEQISFLKNAIVQGEEGKEYDPNKPVFVFCHQPLNNTTPGSDVFGIGRNSDQLKYIFSQHPQVVYVSGHVHNGYVGAEAIYNDGYGMLVDMPCLRANEAVRYTKSIGYNVSVYNDNEIIMTPVNFTDDDEMFDMSIVVDRATRETKNSIYDVKDISVFIDDKPAVNNNLIDDYKHTFAMLRSNAVVTYKFNKEETVDGIRIGTTYRNKPGEISISFSENGIDYSDWIILKLDDKKDIQKLFFDKKTVKAMKFKFSKISNLTMIKPTINK